VFEVQSSNFGTPAWTREELPDFDFIPQTNKVRARVSGNFEL
jgi:hypothetical protein